MIHLFFFLTCIPYLYSSSTCDVSLLANTTIYGTNLDGSGLYGGISGIDCAHFCCTLPDCYAASWVSSTKACWFKSNATLNSEPKVVQLGTELWIIGKPKPSVPAPHGNCKRGVAYGFNSTDDLNALLDGTSWWYNWYYKPHPALVDYSSSEFVPMVWGKQFDEATLIREIPKGAKYLLGFNEPNFFDQANIAPAEAAALWPRIERVAAARNLEIVGPAVNYCGPPERCHNTNPFNYLDAFFTACNNSCKVDYIGAHWYACSGIALADYLSGFVKYGKKVWLTEFSCGDTPIQGYPEQETYMMQSLRQLDQYDLVYRYAWFSGRTTEVKYANLLDTNHVGVKTSLGQIYSSFQIQKPTMGVCNEVSSSTALFLHLSTALQWTALLSLLLTFF